jgi:hypothetical protein
MSAPSIIRRDPPDAVIYDLSIPNQVTITLPSGSLWTSGLHWHETHTEFLQLIKGRIRVRLGDTVQTISASPNSDNPPPEIRVDKNVWHEWSRAEVESGEEEVEDVVVIERTDPADGGKAIFFWNLNGVILEAQSIAKPAFIPKRLSGACIGLWVSLNLFAIFYALDNYPVLLGIRDAGLRRGLVKRASQGEGMVFWLERQYSRGALWIASILIWITGARPVGARFTPEHEWAAWVSRTGKKSQ